MDEFGMIPDPIMCMVSANQMVRHIPLLGFAEY